MLILTTRFIAPFRSSASMRRMKLRKNDGKSFRLLSLSLLDRTLARPIRGSHSLAGIRSLRCMYVWNTCLGRGSSNSITHGRMSFFDSIARREPLRLRGDAISNDVGYQRLKAADISIPTGKTYFLLLTPRWREREKGDRFVGE